MKLSNGETEIIKRRNLNLPPLANPRQVDSAIIDKSIKNGAIPYFLDKNIYHLDTLKQ